MVRTALRVAGGPDASEGCRTTLGASSRTTDGLPVSRSAGQPVSRTSASDSGGGLGRTSDRGRTQGRSCGKARTALLLALPAAVTVGAWLWLSRAESLATDVVAASAPVPSADLDSAVNTAGRVNDHQASRSNEVEAIATDLLAADRELLAEQEELVDARANLFGPFGSVRTITEYALDPSFNPKGVQLTNVELEKLQAALDACTARYDKQFQFFNERAQVWGRSVIQNGSYEDGSAPTHVEPNTVRVGFSDGGPIKLTSIRPGDNAELDVLALALRKYMGSVEARVRTVFQ